MAKFQLAKAISSIPAKTIHSVAKLLKGGAKPVAAKVTKVLPHVSHFEMLMVEAVKKKADYAPDIVAMSKQGLNIKHIAQVLGMSESYCRKLLKGGIVK